jgi:flagellar motor switch/type III secretory pathway protein FliN
MSAGTSTGQPASPALAKVVEVPGANEDEEKRWQPAMGLPCDLTVDLELPGFKVSDLLKMGPGTVLGSVWAVRRDVPLRVNGKVIAWTEFEVVGDGLAVRVTELA